jgi:hypothetical protein
VPATLREEVVTPPPDGEVIVWESAQPMATAQVIPRTAAMRRREAGEKESMAGSFEMLELSARPRTVSNRLTGS